MDQVAPNRTNPANTPEKGNPMDAHALVSPALRSGPVRTIHFVDIENIAGGPVLTEEGVRRAKQVYQRSGIFKEGDLVFIACSQGNAAAVGFGWPEAHLRLGSGRDGADFELIKAIKDERIPERFAHVVIASGDGAVATRTEVLRRAGVKVTVVSRPKGLSTRLRHAATQTALIDTDRLQMFFYAPVRD
jgi:hypothetical protein